MLFFYAKKFGITLEGFQSLLEVVRNHCPKPNKCASSAYKSKRLFSQKFRNVESHGKRSYCTVCCNYIEKDGSCVKEGCAGKDRHQSNSTVRTLHHNSNKEWKVHVQLDFIH